MVNGKGELQMGVESAKLVLPENWEAEERSVGVVIDAVEDGRHQGMVTVCEQARSFTLGMAPVRDQGPYKGRGWREALYRDAIQALRNAIQS